MSANNAIHVQRNSRGKYVAQEGAADGDLPNPEEAAEHETFETLEGLFAMCQERATTTEYGFNVKIDKTNSVIETFQFARKPFHVDAVRVTADNMDLIAAWTSGKVVSADGDKGVDKHVSIDVHRPSDERQKQAFEGDWVLFSGQGFKVYTHAAFKKSFDQASETPKMHEIRPRRSYRGQSRGPKLARSASPESMSNLRKVASAIGKPPRKITEEVKLSEVEDTPQERAVQAKFRDAKSGEYVTPEYAAKNPDTTVREEDYQKGN